MIFHVCRILTAPPSYHKLKHVFGIYLWLGDCFSLEITFDASNCSLLPGKGGALKDSPWWELELPLWQKPRQPWGQEASVSLLVWQLVSIFITGVLCLLMDSASSNLHKQVAHQDPDSNT